MKKRVLAIIMVICFLSQTFVLSANIESITASAMDYYVDYTGTNDQVFFSNVDDIILLDNNILYRKLTVYYNAYYKGLTGGDIIYIEENTKKLVYDQELIEKLMYVSLVSDCWNVECYEISQWGNRVNEALQITNDIGNDLIEKTLGDAIISNFKALLAAFEGNIIEWGQSYKDFILSVGKNTALYFCTIAKLYMLETNAIDSMKMLMAYNELINPAKKGLSYNEAKNYELLFKECHAWLKCCDYYTSLILNSILGGEINDTVDGLAVLKYSIDNIIDETLDVGMEEVYGKDFVSLVSVFKDFKEFSDNLEEQLDTNGKYSYYYNEHYIGALDAEKYYLYDINDLLENVSALTGIEYNTSDIPSNNNYLATEFSATVPDGVYTIKNADSGLMINVYDGKNADGTNVVTWKYDGTTDQRFYVKHIKNGKYALYALCSANRNGEYTRCIDIYTGDTDILPTNGNNIDIYTRSTTWDNCQLFYIVPFEDGTYAFESCAVPKLVIGATNPNKNNGNICMETWNIDGSQRWELCNTGGMTEYDAFENDYVNTGEHGEDIIGVAYTQLGYIELDVTTKAPLYNGEGTWYTKYGQRFNDSTGAWCAYFVMWCAEQAGIPTNVIPQARVYGNCGAFVNWFKTNGKWKSADYMPFPGDIVFFDGDKDGYANHVGIVTGVNEDGSITTIEGNSLSGGGYYQVREAIHSENILGYGAPGFDYADYTNAWITDGGKTKGTAYMLPDTSSETVWYVDTNDECVLLCFDRYADYYLLMYPFLNTGKYVVAYVPGEIVSRYAEPYTYVPDAEEYYDINKQIVLSKDIVSYHNPSTTSLMNGNVDVKIRTEWTAGTVVTVLFEYCGYYFVTTETESGFVPTDKIDLNNTSKPSVPDTDDPIPDQPDVEYPVGDVDSDGVVTEQDGQLVLQFAAKMIELDESQLQCADADENGVVNVADASKIFIMIKNMEKN